MVRRLALLTGAILAAGVVTAVVMATSSGGGSSGPGPVITSTSAPAAFNPPTTVVTFEDCSVAGGHVMVIIHNRSTATATFKVHFVVLGPGGSVLATPTASVRDVPVGAAGLASAPAPPTAVGCRVIRVDGRPAGAG